MSKFLGIHEDVLSRLKKGNNTSSDGMLMNCRNFRQNIKNQFHEYAEQAAKLSGLEAEEFLACCVARSGAEVLQDADLRDLSRNAKTIKEELISLMKMEEPQTKPSSKRPSLGGGFAAAADKV